MNLQITEEENKGLKVHNTPMNLDGLLSNNFSNDWVLPTKSGFYLLIVGSPGSGKTTLLNSIMTTKKRNGQRQSYRKLFHKIIIVSPTLGRGSSTANDKFKDLPDNQKFKDVNMEVLEKIQEIAMKHREDGEHTIVIFDDVGASLRKSATVEKELAKILNNRRHMNLSVIILLQRFRDANPSMRTSASHFITFRPKSMPELEAIGNDLLPFKKQDYLGLFNYIFDDDKHSFLYMDMSLKDTNKYIFYKKFNRLNINDIKNEISV